jgi:hypothetical protein
MWSVTAPRDQRLFQPSADISKWDFGKVQTTLDEIDANENSKAERLVIHYTTMEAAPFIKTGGFRASEYGQGGVRETHQWP